MLYAALIFWLMVVMFSAWGVHRLWSALIQPRVVNSILLPGTLVAQLGHVLGLLITGNAVSHTKLMGDDESGEPEADTPSKQRIPIIGPVVIGLLPLVACGTCLYLSTLWLGERIVADLQAAGTSVHTALPTSLAAFWTLLRDSITLVQHLTDAILNSNLLNWVTVLFLYLSVCLTVRMAPFEGNRRGALGAIVLAGLIIAVIDSLPTGARGFVLSSWPILSFAVAMLLLLLVISLGVSGVVGLVRILAGKE